MTIGENIHNLRVSMGLTLDEVGKACGTGRQTIYKYEKGMIKNIPADKIEAIAKALKVTPTALMGWTAEPIATIIEQLKEEETLIDKLIGEAEDCTDKEIALVIEYVQFLKGRRKKNDK
jgi:repressor LexA